MTDSDLALAYMAAETTAADARGIWMAPESIPAEREAALAAMRLSTALARSLEAWIRTRACLSAARVQGSKA